MIVSLQTGQSFLLAMGTVEELEQENALLLVRITRKIIHLLLTVLIKASLTTLEHREVAREE